MSSQKNKNIPKHLQSSQNTPEDSASLGLYSQTPRNNSGGDTDASAAKSASFGGTAKISRINSTRPTAEKAGAADTIKSATVRPVIIPAKVKPSESSPGITPSQVSAETEPLFPQSGLQFPPVRRLPAMPAEITLNLPAQITKEATDILPVIIRGAKKPVTHTIITPQLTPKAKARVHGFVITGLIGVLIVLAITLTPLTVVRADPLSHWSARQR